VTLPALDQAIEAKMRVAGVGDPTIRAFLEAVRKVRRGERGMVPESAIEPVLTLPHLDELDPAAMADPRALLSRLAVIKLNGGLGTGMGLDRAKSLIPVKGGNTFLDLIARQILHLRRQSGGREPAFYLMNSFSTRADTLAHLRQYPDLWDPDGLDFLQNKVPKIDASNCGPVAWPDAPEMEWCPPGHGDIYPALLGSGLLEKLLARGIRYCFVSNSDNLGATVDARLLGYFAASELSFLMEVARRTAADRKGGHLARRKDSARLMLRELAQTPSADEAQFQDIARHRYFNTNSLWMRLDHLRDELNRNGGMIPLPLIANVKTVDPTDPATPKVLQLESAMGAAIEYFEKSGAIVVPRSRFAPVKTTSDLLALRSDAYVVAADGSLALAEVRCGQPPVVELDARYFKMLPDFEMAFGAGAPSLVRCHSIRVVGPMAFSSGIACEGDVEFVNPGSNPGKIASGTYRDVCVTL
jgi:UDP-N-acetylglucosamine pyrophosphorylase